MLETTQIRCPIQRQHRAGDAKRNEKLPRQLQLACGRPCELLDWSGNDRFAAAPKPPITAIIVEDATMIGFSSPIQRGILAIAVAMAAPGGLAWAQKSDMTFPGKQWQEVSPQSQLLDPEKLQT